MPNIEGKFSVYTDGGYAGSASGAFSYSLSDETGESDRYSGKCPLYTFDASRSNSIYGRSNHVTPINTSIKIWQRTS